MATDRVTSDPRRFSLRLPRPLWIGLATVVLVVTATGMRFGLPIYRQQAAIREIRRLGGDVKVVGRPSWMRGWMYGEVGELFGTATFVGIPGSPAIDRDLGVVRDLPSLTMLSLRGTHLTSAGLVHLRGLDSLEELDLARTLVTDDGVENLARLSGLKRLHIEHTGITDAGLKHLSRLQNLEMIEVYATGVSDEGMAQLQRTLPKLRFLHGRQTIELIVE